MAVLAAFSATCWVWAAVASAFGARLAAVVCRQEAGDGGDLLAACLTLRHLDVALVKTELFAVDVCAEEQIADE